MAIMEDPVVQVGDQVLRTTARDVPVANIRSNEVQDILRRMEIVLDAEPEGAALAAPQIGVPLRVFVISRRVFGPEGPANLASKDPHFVFINPTITRRSKRLERMDEGCLSVRGRYGTIRRHTRATVHAYDEHGHPFTRGASGLLAQAFQHECDHLDGILFIDAAEKVWDVETKEGQ